MTRVVPIDTDAVRRWFDDLVTAWRRAYASAANTERAQAEASLYCLADPVQARVFLQTSKTVPIVACAMLVSRDERRPDREVDVVTYDDEAGPLTVSGGDVNALLVLRSLAEDWHIMRANWTPSRPPDGPKSVRMPRAQRLAEDPDVFVWGISGRPDQLDIDHLLGYVFETRVPASPPPAPREQPRHMYQLGQHREAVGLARWFSVHGEALLEHLGLTGLWWCGLGLLRSEVCDRESDGDIDVVAGPLDLTIGPEELQRRIDDEANRGPLGSDPSRAAQAAIRQVCLDGLIAWPPRVDDLVACEVKASWYDADRGVLKATHSGEGTRIAGQLRLLMTHGFDRFGFLHLVGTKPRETGAHPWIQAGADAWAAHDELDVRDPLIDGPDLDCAGYYRAVVGAVPHKTEDMAGSGGVPVVVRPARPNPLRQSAPSSWREDFGRRLAALEKPPWPRLCIVRCARCGRWNPSSHMMPDVRCVCSSDA